MVVPEPIDCESALAFHASAPIINIAFMIDSPILAFNELPALIEEILIKVFKVAGFSCIVVIIISIGVFYLFLNRFIKNKEKDSSENEAEK